MTETAAAPLETVQGSPPGAGATRVVSAVRSARMRARWADPVYAERERARLRELGRRGAEAARRKREATAGEFDPARLEPPPPRPTPAPAPAAPAAAPTPRRLGPLGRRYSGPA
ncbi:MAG: hypothetical protein DDT21_02412 [Syntrophomonadaceae bacterium]|nr:hypothetical protein [Bacillota bacterium]